MRTKKVTKEYVRIKRYLWKARSKQLFFLLSKSTSQSSLDFWKALQIMIWPPGFFRKEQYNLLQTSLYHSYQFMHLLLAIKPLIWVGYLNCSQGLDNKAVGRIRRDDSHVHLHTWCTVRQAGALPLFSVEKKRPIHQYSLPGYFHSDSNSRYYSTNLWAMWHVLARSTC